MCQRVVYASGGLGHDGGTRVCAQWLGAQSRTGPAVSWAVGENCSPRTSSSSVLNSQVSERSHLLSGVPTGDIAQRRPPGEHSLPSQIQKGEPRVWIPGLNMGPFLQSIQTLTAGHGALSVSFLRSEESGVLFGGVSFSVS